MTMMAGLMRYVFGLNRLFSALFFLFKQLKNPQNLYRITPIMLNTTKNRTKNLKRAVFQRKNLR